MTQQEMVLNIRYDAPKEIWDKIPAIYEQLNGWIGFGQGGQSGEEGIPYWFSFNRNEKHILASLEPSGLQFTGLMETQEWINWIKEIKQISTRAFGFKVGEIESGEVEY